MGSRCWTTSRGSDLGDSVPPRSRPRPTYPHQPRGSLHAMATTTERKHVYRFEEGNASMRDLLGGKGAGLSEMVNMGLPVPPGFTITTAACREFYERGGQ